MLITKMTLPNIEKLFFLNNNFGKNFDDNDLLLLKNLNLKIFQS